MEGDRAFRNRSEAGRELAGALRAYKGRPGALVLGLPRGGVVVAYEVARALRLPLDVLVVRKVGAPGQPELAMGAVAGGGVRLVNRDVTDALGVDDQDIARASRAELRELRRREALYRQDRPALDPRGREVILVDDGLATGSTMRAALQAVRARGPRRVIVAVPVAAAETCAVRRVPVDRGRDALPPDAAGLLRAGAVVRGFFADVRRRGAGAAGAGG
jgi:predicted phosphoribosyltransferase